MLVKIFNFFRLYWSLFWDGKVSWLLKLLIMGLPILYLFVPAPDDFIPFMGALDDAAFFVICAWIFNHAAPSARVALHRQKIDGTDARMAELDTYRHPDEVNNMAQGFAIITGLLILGSYSVGLVLVGMFGLGYLGTSLRRRQIMGNAVQVTAQQFPELYGAFTRASNLLPTTRVNLFVTQDPVMNAYAMSYDEPFTIVLTSGLVEKLSLEEVRGVIGHELGHILMDHVRLTSVMAGLGGFFTLIFYRWSRSCEYSADALALRACGNDPQLYVSALVKISSGLVNAKVDLDQLLNQDKDGSSLHGPAEWLGTHPFILNRIRRIRDLAGQNSGPVSQPSFAMA
jgi:Zn-dependent protease with chaperone function